MELGEDGFADVMKLCILVLFSYFISKEKWCACGMQFFQHLERIKYQSPGVVEE